MNFELTTLIPAIGTIGLIAIVFAESGLFFGFFLPGDSLLFTAGFLASQGLFSLAILLPSLAIAAILGDSVGYAFGAKAGEKLFTRPESRFFKPAYVRKAHEFFLRYGKKAIVLARFTPIIRTFVPIIAGVAHMPYRDFLLFNIIGGITWVTSMLLLGYGLGAVIPNSERYVDPIIIAIIIISLLPTFREFWKEKRSKPIADSTKSEDQLPRRS